MAHCFVSRRLPGPALDRLKRAHDVEIWTERRPPSYDELREHGLEADGLLTMLSDRVDAAFIEAAPNLKAISNYAVGFDNIDLDAASRHAIPVGHTPDVLTDATADLAFTLLLAAARQLPDAIEAAKDGDWITWEPGMYLGQSVYGATLGIVGFGRIGRAVARRGEGFAMKILHTGDGGVPVEELLRQSDFVSLHVPLSAETRHMIDEHALGLMKSTAILVNTARGEVVDQNALMSALRDGRIAGAALDVTEPEPLPGDHPLFNTPNLLITPHIGSATQRAREQMADMAVDNLLAGLEGRPMPHQANEGRPMPHQANELGQMPPHGNELGPQANQLNS